MKPMYILIMPILILSVSSYLKPVHGDNTGSIEIENIQTLPRVIMTEHLFKINATLVNNSTIPVLVENGACDAPFSVAFDTHVLVRKNDIYCTLQLIEHRIDPSREMTFSSPNSALSYVAENGGPVNATLTFPYKRWSPENQSYVKESISKAFSFTIWNSTRMPILSTSENQTIIDTALAIPGLQDWSHDWRYIDMGFLGNNKLGTPYFKWQYAILNLKAPSSSAPFPCNYDWWAWVDIDITTMKVVRATYPTLESHPCQFATGGGPGTLGSEPSGNTTIFESPLKQFKSGISPLNVKCSTNYVLIIKAEDGSPACVKYNDTDDLMNKGWAINQFIVGINYRNQGISVIERDSGYQKYENGTFSQTMMIYVFINNFTQSSYPLKVQVLHDDKIYRTDTISSTDILSDGFYKYQFTQYGAIFGSYKIIATYGNKTSQTSFGNPIPP